jgi:hypothetical protein
VEGLERFSEGRIVPDAVTLDVRVTPRGHAVRYFDVVQGELVEVSAEAVVIATPFHTHKYLLRDDSVSGVALSSERLLHQPWMVANLLFDSTPDGPGGEVAWDNVLYGSDSLGYVSATHQSIAMRQERSLTHLLPSPSLCK